MGDVVKLNLITTVDLDADEVLDGLKGKLDGFVLAGYDRDGNEFFSSTYGKNHEILWLLERLKKAVIDVDA